MTLALAGYTEGYHLVARNEKIYQEQNCLRVRQRVSMDFSDKDQCGFRKGTVKTVQFERFGVTDSKVYLHCTAHESKNRTR